MLLNTQLLMDVIVVGIIAEIVGLQTVQMIKAMLATPKWIKLVSLLVNLALGVVLTLFFTDGTWQMGLFAGFFAWIGADALYQALSKGIQLPSHKDLKTPMEDPFDIGSVVND